MSRKRITEAFLAAFSDDFAAHGQEAIERVRKENPSIYVQCAAKLLPQQIEAKVEVSEVDLLAEQMECMTQRERIAFQRNLLDELERDLNTQERLNKMLPWERAKLTYEAEKLEPRQPGSP
jgi:hypothetical protein